MNLNLPPFFIDETGVLYRRGQWLYRSQRYLWALTFPPEIVGDPGTQYGIFDGIPVYGGGPMVDYVKALDVAEWGIDTAKVRKLNKAEAEREHRRLLDAGARMGLAA